MKTRPSRWVCKRASIVCVSLFVCACLSFFPFRFLFLWYINFCFVNFFAKQQKYSIAYFRQSISVFQLEESMRVNECHCHVSFCYYLRDWTHSFVYGHFSFDTNGMEWWSERDTRTHTHTKKKTFTLLMRWFII